MNTNLILIILLIINLANVVFLKNFFTLDQLHFKYKKNLYHFFQKKLQNKIKFVFIHNIFKLEIFFLTKINKPLYVGVTLFIT